MTTLTVTVKGTEAVQRVLDRVTPSKRPQIWRSLLTETGAEIVRSARSESIIGGGRIRVAGPRGGKGKLTDAKPHPTRLTSRSGIGRGSIRLDSNGLPRFVEVGSDRKYMAVHETGGSFDVPSKIIRKHKRTVAFGKKFPEFDVGPYLRLGYVANFPKRAWLQPAIDKTHQRSDEILLRAFQKAVR